MLGSNSFLIFFSLITDSAEPALQPPRHAGVGLK